MYPFMADFAAFADQIKPLYIILAVVFLAIALGIWIYRLRTKSLSVNTSDESLTIFISRSGLQELLSMACSTYPNVHCTRTSIQIDQENRICPHVHFSLGGNANLKDIQTGLKQRIQETLKTHLGQDQIGNIEFTVSGFRPDTEFLPTQNLLETESPLPSQESPKKKGNS